MFDQGEVAVVRWPGQAPSVEKGLSALLAAYHLRTEAEKGESATEISELPDKYRAEVSDPRTAFIDDAVLVAVSGDTAVGCLVVTAAADGRSEIKRLWTDPGFRSRGVATRLLEAALAHAADSGVGTVRLSVWRWRTEAIALYERIGFVITDSWDHREHLVCMQLTV
ncbi:ribosomal protein S18 acetylase RimI-like enzyme [Catenulispora sp. GP43]|uniref:GNAT family N-acetyltransferase n=1 Tax=Catenulispora sp. GP43 TaxID=3156263 RepID=UPI0035162436